MKTLFATLLFLTACGDDAPQKYKGTITCDFMCDGMTAQTMIPVCATDDDINAKLQAGVDACVTESVASNCAQYNCQCTIPNNLPTCD
jgi:hypothetical protein